MMALEISLLMKGLWLYHIYRFFFLSKISVQIVENASFFIKKLSLYIKFIIK